MKKHFDDKDIGNVDAWNGELDDIPMYIFAMKEPDYIMSIMANYGATNEVASATTKCYYKVNGVEKTTSFKYTEPFFNHFKYRYVIDKNNHQRMQPISIEETWKMHQWEHRPYTFFLGVTTSNTQYGYNYFGKKSEESVLSF